MAIPTNIIIIWSGAISEIPNGWFLCNGSNGTPNLQDRFIVGGGNLYSLDNTGGTSAGTLLSHTHVPTGSISGTLSHSHNFARGANSGGQSGNNRRINASSGGSNPATSSSGNHSHTITLSSEGSANNDLNLPPYYALAYIMYGGE